VLPYHETVALGVFLTTGLGIKDLLRDFRAASVKRSMKIKPSLVGIVSLVASAFIASASPAISAVSENAMRISSAHVVKAPWGGGSYVTGLAEPSFGYSVPRAAHVHISVYDVNGKLLGEKIDKLNSPRLVRSHLNPHPRTSYVAFFPWEPSQIAKVTIVEHSGHVHPSS